MAAIDGLQYWTSPADVTIERAVTDPEASRTLSPEVFQAGVEVLLQLEKINQRTADILEKHYQAGRDAEQKRRPAPPAQKPDAE